MSNKLPEFCFVKHPEDGHPVLIVRGEMGYREVTMNEGYTVESANAEEGIEPHVAEAMMNGSMFGWDVPAADPEFMKQILPKD